MNPQPLDEFLKALRQDPALATHSSLLRLSALSPEEVEEFKLGWAMLPAPSRHEVAAKLVGMTEENTDMDFSSVFLVCIDDSEASV
ncbi:MAG: hypothetical protein FJ317_03215, partial [SAR202 cluster bacterium]|nr:hypothetical protein [SAR202 cluster bacterium]